MSEPNVCIVIERHCTCGGSIKAKSSPPSAAEAIVAVFAGHHTGDGHAPATAQQARNARRREDRQRVREYARQWDNAFATMDGAE